MTTYAIDTAHSEIAFTVRHMMFAKVRGRFNDWKASLAWDGQDPASAVLRVDVATASIDTREPKRDEHLRSADFFDVARFPAMTFVSKRIEPSDGTTRLVGDLTIRGETHEVTLDVEATGGGKDPWGNQRLGFSAKGAISRSDFGLRWNQALETGGVLVSDKVEIDVEVQLVASSATVAA